MNQLVLVTGATGFIGSHVVAQLLAKGYRVRAAARSVPKLQKIFPNASGLEMVEVPTLTSDYTESLKGVDTVIHMAAELFSKGSPSDHIFEAAYNGTLNIVRQSIDAGIKKIIITGTFASLFDSQLKLAFGTDLVTEKFFHPVTLETLNRDQPPMAIYQQSKTLADKKMWELAKEHPDIDFTILLPPAVFGPLVPNFPLTDSQKSIGTNYNLSQIITTGTGAYPAYPLGHLADVRDVAHAHVAALSAPPSPGRDKRFIIFNTIFTWKKVADLIRRDRPELANRLPNQDLVPPRLSDAPLDTTFAAEVLGLKEYIPWEETVLAAIDVHVAWEKQNGLGSP
ncbi:NAD-P-binding protein [Lentinula detonsa]|uniref:NAD-P-binding protein n=1 Tax=Lentinula detonsa TaxID=2804962 RepID=A0A9W8NYF3_9AGAR|nr:NAD-P-binding protein [Lentinula detonsa]